ncbi:MAG: hypothetical protein ACREXI_11650 [Caldimonas sp.]
MNVSTPLLFGAAALVLALPGLWLDRPVFFACWLAAWWLMLSVVLGALGNAWVHRLTGGRWGTVLRPATSVLARRLPGVLLLFVPLFFFGLDAVYPWAADPSGAWRSELAQPGFNQVWLSPGFFTARLLVYGAVWWWLARPAALDAMTQARAAASLIVHALVTSLAAIDLLMSLMPVWYSTGFALLVLTGQMLAGSAFTVGLTARWGAARVPPAAPPAVPVWRDFGNLLLMWVMSWAYLAFMQFLIIWAENLPREIAWYLPRLDTGWRTVGVALVLLNFALPLLALLFRALKDRPERLAPLAFALLGANALDVAWMVLPSVAPASLAGWWLLPLLLAGMGLVLFGDAPHALRDAVRERRSVRRHPDRDFERELDHAPDRDPDHEADHDAELPPLRPGPAPGMEGR